MKAKPTRVNQKGNEHNGNDQRTPQTIEPQIPVTSSHDIVIPHLSLSPSDVPLIDITQLDNQLSNSGDLMMVAKNITGDVQASKTTH